MKLHLGCGEQYLDGYENIDFPLSCHTVQVSSIADKHADITTLRYPAESVSEIRLHHVFEHFSRPVACGLLGCWYSWLRPGGVLHLEVPDFSRTAKIMVSPFSSFKKRAVAERHLYGSHEASWAVHREGYSSTMLKYMLSVFGFDVVRVAANDWSGTYNIEVISSKVTGPVAKGVFVSRADTFLRNYLIDTSATEVRILQVWMNEFTGQLEKGWAE